MKWQVVNKLTHLLGCCTSSSMHFLKNAILCIRAQCACIVSYTLHTHGAPKHFKYITDFVFSLGLEPYSGYSKTYERPPRTSIRDPCY